MSTDQNRDIYGDPVPPRTVDADRTRPVDLDGDGLADGVAGTRADDGVATRPVVADDVTTTRAVDADGDGVADRREASLREVVTEREVDRFGGIKFGSAFFGWLTALGALVALSAVAAAIGAATGLMSPDMIDTAAEAAQQNLAGATIVGAIALAVVLFVAYFAGGYVAGRMARFSGAKQGFAVWLWAIVIAIVVALLTMLAGSEWDILANVDVFPRIPVTAETATLTGIVTAVGAALIALIAAMLGGMAGMNYHRRVDRVGLGA